MTKSCTTKDDDYPIVYRVLTIPGGCLGFCPSKVSLLSFLPGFWVCDMQPWLWLFRDAVEDWFGEGQGSNRIAAWKEKITTWFLDWRYIFVKWLEKLPASHVSFFGMLMLFCCFFNTFGIHPYCLGRFWAKSWALFFFSATKICCPNFRPFKPPWPFDPL